MKMLAKLVIIAFIHVMDSHESFMELEGSLFENNSFMDNISHIESVPVIQPITGSVTLQIEHWERRLRNFNVYPPPVLFQHQLLERSQSSLSFTSNRSLTPSMTNQLGSQNGIVHRIRKCSRTEDTIGLSDALNKRRSRSADSRFSESSSGPKGVVRGNMDITAMPSTSRRSRLDIPFVPVLLPDIKIQVYGKGVEI